MTKFTAYHLTADDIIEILGKNGYILKSFDCDKGIVGIKVETPDGKDEDDYREQAYKYLEKYFCEVLGIENPKYFCSDGDQPHFELLVVPGKDAYSVA